MNYEFHEIMEWSAWANLDAKKDIELILLKGHLILENLIDVALVTNGFENKLSSSFHGKAKILKKIEKSSSSELGKLSELLLELNGIRNKIAHEFLYDINDGEVEAWSLSVLSSFEGIKFSKFTYRTKIVHAFSALASALAKI
nr:hypothetical protein [uncultured Marinobacter sp.]